MLARLWWKEARQFWPIWLFLVLLAVGCQWALLRFLGADARSGTLGALALAWTCLYGCAAGAAAIAGERENRTLTFLDTLGLSRPAFWGGKASFAVLSTLGLGAVLFGIAALGTDRWETSGVGLGVVVAACAVMLLEVVGWGLLWSSVVNNPLTAAILTLFCLVIIPVAVEGSRDGSAPALVSAAPWRLAVTAAALAVSYAVVVRGEPGGRTRREARRVVVLEPRKPGSGPPVAPWRPAVRSLAWQAAREARPVWLRLAGLFAVTSLLCLLTNERASSVGVALALSWPAGVIAGVSAFGAENRARTYRFHAHHGVSPGTVWAVKVGVWGLGLAALGVPVALAAWLFEASGPPDERGLGPSPFLVPLELALAASVGMLSGMVVRRGITAAVVATGVLLVTTPVLLGLLRLEVVPPWSFAALPLGCLVVSRAWAADWVYDRPGARRWVRLGLLTAAACGATFASYAAYRVFSVPEADVAALRAHARPAADLVPGPGENAAEVYGEAMRALRRHAGYGKLLRENAEALALVRRAAALPNCRFPGEGGRTVFDRPAWPGFSALEDLVAESVRDRQRKGDLAGAWDDLVVLFRMAAHLGGGQPAFEAERAFRMERTAIGLALRWAADARQTPDRLKAALDAYQALPTLPGAAEVVAAAADDTERTLRMPADALADELSGARVAATPSETPVEVRFVAAIATTPWEIARARRSFRLLFSEIAAQAALEPWARRPDTAQVPGVVNGTDLGWVFRSTPLVKRLFQNFGGVVTESDRNLVDRRALLQVLALRRWQLRHGGRLPEVLQELVHDGELGALPLDPFSGRTFGYVASRGQSLWPLGVLDVTAGASSSNLGRPTGGSRLLYSVGTDRTDNGAIANEVPGPPAWSSRVVSPWLDERSLTFGIPGVGAGGDIIFPLRDRPGAVPLPPTPTEGEVPAANPGAGAAIMMGLPGAAGAKPRGPEGPPP